MVARSRTRPPTLTSSTCSRTRSQPRSLLSIARLNKARLRARRSTWSRTRIDHTSLDSSPENRGQEESNNLKRSGGKQIDDVLDGFVGAVVGGFEFAGRLVGGIGGGVEAAVGEGPAQPLVEEQEEQRHFDALR